MRKNGLLINHKRTLRIYRALALNLPRRVKKRVPARVKQPLTVPIAASVCWSLDCTSDVLTDGRRFRTLNVLDDYNRQLLGVETDFSLPAARVVHVLTRLVKCHGPPTQLRTDNGPEFISTRLSEWCEAQGIVLHWIQPGKLTHKCVHRALQRLIPARVARCPPVSLAGPRARAGGRVGARLQYAAAAPSVKFHDPT